MTKQNNEFLKKLLDLEVSGKEAIVTPSNWNEEPLLNVETYIDKDISDNIDYLMENPKSQGIWWFLIGSPGNGKSAAIGKIVRTLKKKETTKFIDPISGIEFCDNRSEEEASQETQGTNEYEEIPYQLELSVNNNFPTAIFAQDASVVKNPYEKFPDAGKDLATLLDTAYKRGQSVVVCVNRGIVEKALQVEGVASQPWYHILKAIQSGDTSKWKDGKSISFDAKKSCFDNAILKATSLDSGSIIADGSFKKLLEKATTNKNWDICNNCSSKVMCPFNQNREWLINKENKEKFVKKIRYAELLGGQAVVFREAIALISLILSGSPRDYINISPCEWVHEKIEKNWVFSLLSRRLYMILFKSYAPYGLKHDEKARESQIRILTENLNSYGSETKNALKGIKNDNLSVDLGLTHFLARGGILNRIDPVRENQGKKIERRWNVSKEKVDAIQDQNLVSTIENTCFKVWFEMEDSISELAEEKQGDFYKELRRWITTVSYRLGFFTEGKMLFENELIEYEELLSNKEERNNQDIANRSHQIEESFEKFVFGENELKVRINESLTVYGSKITGMLEPEIDWDQADNNCLNMKIGEETFIISPMAYAWLKRMQTTGLIPNSVPQEIRNFKDDVRHRAAASVNYSTIQRGIKLELKKPNGALIRLSRHGNLLTEITDSDRI